MKTILVTRCYYQLVMASRKQREGSLEPGGDLYSCPFSLGFRVSCAFSVPEKKSGNVRSTEVRR